MEECGKMLLDNKYDVRVLNLKDFSKSLHYNPFAYIRKDRANADISKFVTTLIENTSGKDAKEDFWVNAEKMLLTALVGFVYYSPKIREKEKNFRTLCQIFNAMKTSQVGDNTPDAVDILFQDMEQEQGDIFPVRVYKKYKKSSGDSGASVLMCAATRLSVFETDEILDLTEYDELDFASMNNQKTALFVITDDTDNTFGFLGAMMYSQLFNTLCNIADNNKNHRLDIPLRCIMDEFANLGKIPNVEILISTIRSRDISMNIILQSISQLKSLYDKKAQGIVSNCDTFLFLGGNGEDDTKMVSENLGKETIDIITYNESKGKNGSYTKNASKTGLELMAKNEIGLLDGGKCLLFIRGVVPFKSDKFDITSHRQYKKLYDYDDNNFCPFEYVKAHRKDKAYKDSKSNALKLSKKEKELIEYDVTDEVSA